MSMIDLDQSTVRELNQRLHQQDVIQTQWQIKNPRGKHNIAVGVMHPATIHIDGHVGYYCGGMNQLATLNINGNAGSGVAENIMSGRVHIKGNASQYAASSGHGGLVVIEGDASSRCGISMKGVNIVVGGSVGHMSAFLAQKGCLVVCGDAGENLGASLYEAVIYVRGKVSSLGEACIEKPMHLEHINQLQALLIQAGINANPTDFRRYGSTRQHYHFYSAALNK
ncbi:glutamate synthase family protein [Beggiatoa alba B18LD]|uniref:Glutamate synthase family protein n=1 Tax=Beggiatoa alba B18LD TaxID=395493 RepID=I3CBV8_9GAMM|nr:protein glxC [Beggiatoa alba]EIJ41101.1 glutamate synthase family protein [Beggiatoa alba B18LD]